MALREHCSNKNVAPIVLLNWIAKMTEEKEFKIGSHSSVTMSVM
jgi:hypothetical protein